MINRRQFIKTSAATGLVAGSALGGLCVPTWAKSSMALGDKKIEVLSDGNLRLPINMILAPVPEAERNAFLSSHNMSTESYEPSCNLTLVDDGERKILFDVGAGGNFMPSAGKLSESMDTLGIDPSDITHVVFTHAHPDHILGLLDDFDEPLFSEAEYMISKPEWDYWIDPETVNSIGEERVMFALGAKRNLEAIEDRISRFNFGDEILPGIQAVDTSGHTPGHAAFEIRAGNESVMVVGDALTNQYISFEKPDWKSGSDQDQDKGVATRKRLLDQITTDKMNLIGFHMPFPGIGTVEKADGAYKFLAA